MPTFGQDLKTAREGRGVSLDEIAQQTKVSLRHLQALEGDRLEILPGGVFNRGILRNYLQFLHMEEADWLVRFSQIPGNSGAASREGEWARPAEIVPGFKPSPLGEEDVRFRWLGVLLLFVVLVGAAWLVWHFAGARWRLRHGIAQPAQHALLYSGYAVC